MPITHSFILSSMLVKMKLLAEITRGVRRARDDGMLMTPHSVSSFPSDSSKPVIVLESLALIID